MLTRKRTCCLIETIGYLEGSILRNQIDSIEGGLEGTGVLVSCNK